MDRLTPSQAKTGSDIEDQMGEYSMYGNYILRGATGSGKSYLLKQLAEEKSYDYIEFEEEFGEDFFKNNDYRVIDEMILLKYIETQIDNKNSDRTIVIDNLNSILNSIREKKRINNLIGSFLRRKYRNKYILVISDSYLQDQHLEIYDRIFNLRYELEDNEFLSNKNKVIESISKGYKNGHYYTLSK